jgi:hypothetical protein
MDVAFKMQIARVTSYEHLAQQLCDGMHLHTDVRSSRTFPRGGTFLPRMERSVRPAAPRVLARERDHH